MKASVPIFMAVVSAGMLNAAPPKESPTESKPGRELGEVKAQQPVKLEKATAKTDAWTRASYGVLGQFVQAPSILAPINPAAKPEAGSGESNLNRDTVTGRVMGLCLLKFEF